MISYRVILSLLLLPCIKISRTTRMKQKKEKEVSIGLNCYVIRLRKKGETENYLSITDAFGKKNFKTIMQDFIKTIDTKTYMNEEENRILYLDRIITIKDDLLTGILKRGYSGHESYVDEIKNAKANTINTIKRDHFNSTPFFFLVSQPTVDAKHFIFLAQSYKQYGFKEIFQEAFKGFVQASCPNDTTCEIATLSVPALFNKLLDQGDLRKLRFKKHSLPKNYENVLDGNDDRDPANYEVEMSIRAKKKGFLGIKTKMKSMKEDALFVEIVKFDDFNYDEAIADVSISGRKRTLNITRPSDFGASYDITDKSAVSKETNHPDFSKVETEALSILRDDIIPNLK